MLIQVDILSNDTIVTPTDTIDVSQGKSIVNVDNVTGDFNNGISDVLANFATNGSTTDDFRSLLADDSEVNITVNDTTGTLDASSLAVLRNINDTSDISTRGSMEIMVVIQLKVHMQILKYVLLMLIQVEL